jgi:hypothetical protein
MTDVYIADRLIKVIRERQESITGTITEGSVPDFAGFRYLRGKLEAWKEVERELRLLLKKQERHDE